MPDKKLHLSPAAEQGLSSQLDIAGRASVGEAEEAALQVAEATDQFAAGGISVEAAAQAEQIAGGEVVQQGDGEAELTVEERKAVSRSVFRLAWPAIAENTLQTLMGIVDTAVVARLGTDALSGVGASQQLIWVLTTALIAVSMGTTVLVARFTGAHQHEKASAVLKQSLMLAAVVGLALIPVSLLSHPLLSMLGLTGAAANDGATYLSITLQFAMLIVLMFVAGAALRGSGDTKTPMFVTGFINIINAVLAVALVFGGVRASSILGDWLGGLLSLVGVHSQIRIAGLDWLPELGVAGSAWAAVIARGVGTAILLGIFLLPRSRLHLWQGGGWRPNFSLMGRMLAIGIPSAVEQMLMSVGILVYSFIVISMGEVIFATSRLATNAIFLSQMPGFGFAVAATTLVGQSLGARQPRRAQVGSQIATRSALILMSIMGGVFFFFGGVILRVFTDDPQLLSLGGEAMKVIAFSQPPLALAFVLAGSLRGAGDVRYPMVVTTVAVWFVRLPVGAFLGLPAVCLPFTASCIPGLGLGLRGIYTALIVEAVVRAAFMYRRFRSGKWQTIKV
ncbi:MAG: MATE family efflux transporter [Chloroflexi bacterium]|nr:MATE family efflux transporter [Chloroflexota bacterium]